jgi:signal transduction histidine kinase
MFVRILGVLLACVVAAQLVNFGLMLLMGPPPPPIYSVSQVAAVLRKGTDATGDFKARTESNPARSEDAMAQALAGALARQLGVGDDSVRLKLFNPPHLVGRRWHDRRGADMMMPGQRDGVLVGDFTASLRRADGTWLSVLPSRSRFGAWRMRALLWLLAALAAATPFAWMLARRAARPIGMFATAAERIGRDPHADPLPVKGPAEIAHAATAFNEMQRRLNRYVDDRTMMVAAIAHDLRTPLMRLGLRLEKAPADLRDAAERDVAEMEAMIVAATDYVRDVTRTGPRRKLDLRALAEAVVDDHADRGGNVTLAPGDALVMTGDASALKAILNNLVENALRYGGDAEVSIEEAEGHATLEVRDHGGGFAEDDLPRAFEPFFRGERSRNRDTGGMGLGLASVRGLARAHGGDATIENHAGGGALARVRLPL